MTVSKVRIYDLAKELKLDTKRLIEEIRREGVDVSVPSNSVSTDLAEKIRIKYFPKKETVVKRTVKVVKRAARPVAEEAAPAEAEEAVAAAPTVEVTVEEPTPVAPSAPAAAARPSTTARLVKKLSPAIRAEQPAPADIVEIPETVSTAPEAIVEIEEAPEPVATPAARVPQAAPAPVV